MFLEQEGALGGSRLIRLRRATSFSNDVPDIFNRNDQLHAGMALLRDKPIFEGHESPSTQKGKWVRLIPSGKK